MKKRVLFCFLFLTSACAMNHQPTDVKTDQALGVSSGDDIAEAEKTVQSLQENQREEQYKKLQRQITDPLANQNR